MGHPGFFLLLVGVGAKWPCHGLWVVSQIGLPPAPGLGSSCLPSPTAHTPCSFQTLGGACVREGLCSLSFVRSTKTHPRGHVCVWVCTFMSVFVGAVCTSVYIPGSRRKLHGCVSLYLNPIRGKSEHRGRGSGRGGQRVGLGSEEEHVHLCSTGTGAQDVQVCLARGCACGRMKVYMNV